MGWDEHIRSLISFLREAAFILLLFINSMALVIRLAWNRLLGTHEFTQPKDRPITTSEQLKLRRDKKTIAVVGGSFAGIATATHLSLDPLVQVVLIERKTYFEYTPGILRALVEPESYASLTCPIAIPNVRVVYGEACDVSDKSLTVKLTGCNGKTMDVNFDYLVLAHGSTYFSPIKATSVETGLAMRQQSMNKFTASLPSYKRVTIVGAGLVGIELAAEIAIKFPQLRISIHSMNPTILPGFHPSVIKYVEDFFKAHKVTMVVNSTFNIVSYAPSSDELFLPCVGITPSPLTWAKNAVSSSSTSSGPSSRTPTPPLEFHDSSLSSTCVRRVIPPVTTGFGDVQGNIPVLSSQQSPRASNVFAVGDVSFHPAGLPKMAFVAEADGHGVAIALSAMVRGKKACRYPQSLFYGCNAPGICCISLGPKDGILIFNQLRVYGRIASFAKAFIEQTKVRAIGQSLPYMLLWEIGDCGTALVHALIEKGQATLTRPAAYTLATTLVALTSYIFVIPLFRE